MTEIGELYIFIKPPPPFDRNTKYGMRVYLREETNYAGSNAIQYAMRICSWFEAREMYF